MSHQGPPTLGAGVSSTTYLSSSTTTVVVTSCTATSSSLDQVKIVNFDKNSPRPPVLGEEHEPREGSSTHGSHWGMCGPKHSPSLTPRRISYHQNTPFYRESDAPLGFEPEGSERVTPVNFVELGTPPYLRWAISLASLLEDPDGRALFQKYLEGERSRDMLNFYFACEGLKNAPREDANLAHLIKLIHKRYFKTSNSLKVSETFRNEMNRRVREVIRRECPPDRRLFDEAQKQVENFLNNTAYPEFLRSETYLQHVRAMQSGLGAGSSSAVVGVGGSEEECSSSSSSTGKEMSTPIGMLPTLHEDAELDVQSRKHHRHHIQQQQDPAALPLTQDMLIATQRKRAQELRTKPESYTMLSLQQSVCSSGSTLPNPYHMPTIHHRGAPGLSYSAYNPVSRQDSELQSLSSGAHTEDSASITSSSLDGGSLYRFSRRHSRQIRENASYNRDPHMHQTIIPRTQRMPKENLQALKPKEFAAILIQKLECVQKYQELQEKLERKLKEDDVVCEDTTATGSAQSAGLLSEVIRGLQTNKVDSSPPSLSDRMHCTDASNQAILDMHVSRVWSDLTPSRSPSLVSPRPGSPEGRRRIPPPGYLPISGGTHTLHPAQSPMTQVFYDVPPASFPTRMGRGVRHLSKDKDGVSTLSSDSGNVHDYTDKHSHHHLPKSKSMQDYIDAQKQESFSGHDPSRPFVKEMARKTGGSSSRRTLTNLTDSGVSVVSDTPLCPPNKDNSRVLCWLVQSEARQTVSSSGYSHSDSSRHKARSSGSSGSSLQRQTRGSKKAAGNSGSKSDSVELDSVAATMPPNSWSHNPAQPFMADPSMPLLPLPNTATQLEEARRRLEDVRGSPKGNSSRQRFLSSSKTLLSCGPSLSLPLTPSTESAGSGHLSLRRHAATPTSCTSTLGRTAVSQPQPPSQPQAAASGHITVMFTFCDEEVPYRTKVTGNQVTLRQFKEILPKKGNYRYFFKTECEDFDALVIQEEVMDDSEILPLWEGKIMAQVKPVD
ncbi:hypothetical protein B566_EDAN011456 [Ephemera danica]|nr:hypothetical protein B566_EDAN011456 [Ephemera danica]